ncbi:MAG TPA: PAS domain-containing protein [Actinomycetota bacterium]|nr:PAS domain-containing protein [Actinomycetota bacterium]
MSDARSSGGRADHDADGPFVGDYRELVEGIPAMLYLDYPDEFSTNFYTSPQAEALLGYTQEEWGTDQELWLRIIHPDDVDAVRAENERSNAAGDRFHAEYRVRAADGQLVWIRDDALLVRDREGAPAYWRGIMLDVTAEKEAEEKLRRSLDMLRRTLQQRRDLAQKVETAQEEERRLIAADIHDDPIQVMSAVDLRLAMLAERPETITTAALGELRSIVSDSIERLRSLVFELHPAALEREGLVAAIDQYLSYAAKDAGWSYEIVDELSDEPPPELRVSLYRTVQEAVANARKHAGASRVSVRVATAGDGVTVIVTDDGTGFDTGRVEPPEPGHLGLATMIERAELIGGWCRLSSSAAAGTTVECWLPWEGRSVATPSVDR